MPNMTFGTNILPADNTLSLGNNEKKWNIYGDVNGNVNGDVTGTASKIATGEDTANDLNPLGVTSGATTTVKRNTTIVFNNGKMAVKNKNTGSTDVSLQVNDSGRNGVYVNGYHNGSSFVSDPKWLIERNSDGSTTLGAGAVTVESGDLKTQNGNGIIRRKLSADRLRVLPVQYLQIP